MLHLLRKVLLATMATLVSSQAWAQEPPKMKMTTEVPPGIATPDRLDTRIGTLSLDDGVPDQKTAQVVYDNLDFQRGVQAFLQGIPVASMSAMRRALLGFGPPNETVLLFENLMDSKSLWLTPNTTSIYMLAWLKLGEEPMVIETPPNVLGIIDDHWFRYVADFGKAGPDKGEGGKFLVLPPRYEGEVPDGYFVCRTKTYGNWVIWRGSQVDGDPAPAVESTKRTFRMYPLSRASNPPRMNFINGSGTYHNTIHRMDYEIFREIDEVVQAEPADSGDPEILGLLASIGIKKGVPFQPDARMKRILTDAANVGAVTVRTLAFRPRDDLFYVAPGESAWIYPFAGGSHEYINEGIRLLDARSAFHFFATGITPAMTSKISGKGSSYAVAYIDSAGNAFDGSKTYRIHVPPDVPAKDFWSFMAYDTQTRSMLQTDQRFPGIDSNKPGLLRNSDGSYDIYFAPVAPDGLENNWIQTIPGRGWSTMFRLYGPLEPWFEATWRPGEFELMK